jgi:hypothetical protein
MLGRVHVECALPHACTLSSGVCVSRAVGWSERRTSTREERRGEEGEERSRGWSGLSNPTRSGTRPPRVCRWTRGSTHWPVLVGWCPLAGSGAAGWRLAGIRAALLLLADGPRRDTRIARFRTKENTEPHKPNTEGHTGGHTQQPHCPAAVGACLPGSHRARRARDRVEFPGLQWFVAAAVHEATPQRRQVQPGHSRPSVTIQQPKRESGEREDDGRARWE